MHTCKQTFVVSMYVKRHVLNFTAYLIDPVSTLLGTARSGIALHHKQFAQRRVAL
jgi:hypothetical protein